ncbi:YdhR family protein [Flagellimonas eckloniae]|uniref:Monooxygenase n=1 Tax=Flagellimonas eckloniae TaxID=346185 RepID=A0A0Q1CGT9_9FLAO|nr:YdhR family protein [Allomuricauda eckloniae]KQC30118.1 hypothetical protein AAY42_09705 [Allomuricauda eckloniae]
MKNVTAVLSVKFNSSHSQERLMEVCNEDLNLFRNVSGLIEKYYIAEETTGAISGIYLFETKSARNAFWTSELAAKIPERYGVIAETLRVEEYNMAIVLNESVLS